MTSGVKMGQIEWAMWANEQAIVSSSIIILGGILGVAGFFKGWEIGIYAIVAGVLVFIFEYPRGKRLKGRTQERMFQKYFTKLLSCCGPVSRNYFIRFIMHLILCIPIMNVWIFLQAAFKGEEWKPVGLEEKTESTAKLDAKSFRQPKMPPPRAPPSANQI
ncbi:CYBA [Mytilus edulis]|uniref:Cytochrome b-245 light chain n=1 Tax=Mytilus edulis TaxID=6550 RepID=A0A8S3U8B5_MYTED|nr:CYBA [Mytilus edulis]